MPVYDTAERRRKLLILIERAKAEVDAIDCETARRERHVAAARAHARLAREAPTPAVRAWARAQGMTVPDVGKLPTSLREQYIQHQTQEASTAS